MILLIYLIFLFITVGKKIEMSETAVAATQVTETPPPSEKKLKPCCACPETKKVRDAW